MGRRLRLAIARALGKLANRAMPASPCAIRDRMDSPWCNGTACRTCGTWDKPTC